MHTNCPQCSQKLVVEDDKVPAGPFMLRCPKCQTALKLPGKGGAPASPPPPPRAEAGSPAGKIAPAPPKPLPAAAPTPAAPPPSPPAAAVRSEAPTEGGNGRALVVLTDPSDPGLQQAVVSLLQKNGYGIDTATEAQRGVQLLERTRYALVVTTPNGAPGPGHLSLYKRVVALAPETRRNLFLVLLGSEFSSGDGTQAFAAMADLVLHPKDLGSADDLLHSTVAERHRIYQAFLDAQTRLDRRKY